MAFQTTTVNTDAQLQQILQLQAENLRTNISAETQQQQGFVSLQHTFPVLKQMHDIAPSIIATDGSQLAGYALTMPRECRHIVPDLEPMFSSFEQTHWNDRPLSEYRFYVMGQICVAEAWRGQGVFDALYQQHRASYSNNFDCIVTEIATRNLRSMRAHERVGFKTIHVHQDELDEWAVVIWDWS
jgi:hypothetical protein